MHRSQKKIIPKNIKFSSTTETSWVQPKIRRNKKKYSCTSLHQFHHKYYHHYHHYHSHRHRRCHSIITITEPATLVSTSKHMKENTKHCKEPIDRRYGIARSVPCSIRTQCKANKTFYRSHIEHLHSEPCALCIFVFVTAADLHRTRISSIWISVIKLCILWVVFFRLKFLLLFFF